MTLRVRSPEGEVEFQSWADVHTAYTQHLIAPDDEILDEGKTLWVKARNVPRLAGPKKPPGLLEGPRRWYALGGAIGVVGAVVIAFMRSSRWALFVAFGLGLLVSGYLTWATKSSFKKGPGR